MKVGLYVGKASQQPCFWSFEFSSLEFGLGSPPASIWSSFLVKKAWSVSGAVSMDSLAGDDGKQKVAGARCYL
jgi:hypothetical protein